MSKIFFFLLALFSASSQAFTTLDPYMVPAEIRQVNNFVSVDGDTVKVNVMGKGYAGNQPYFNKTIAIPKKNFLSWLKANLKNLMKINPWWIAFAAAMAAAGWAFDELLNQMTVNVNTHLGSCGSRTNITLLQCAKFLASDVNGTYKSHTYNSGPMPLVIGKSTRFDVYYSHPSWGSNVVGSIVFTPTSVKVEQQPVTDTSLLDSVFSEFIKNPVTASQAMTAPSGYPYDELFKGIDLKYIPGVSEADYPALDCYFRGALQTSNAGAACYATEAEYQRIKQIAEQLKAGATPGGVADSLNDQLKDPLTQAQFEESLNKLKDSDVSKVTDDASKIYDEGFKQLNDSIVADSLPGMPDLIPIPQFHTGTCRSIPINFNLAGVNVTKQFPGETGCAQIEKMKEFLGWLMAVGVAIGLMFAALREAN